MLAIEFTDDVDPTGLATLALALITLVALLYTRRALKQTKEEIDLSRREVEEAHRPVVVPVVDRSRTLTVPGFSRPIGPLLIETGSLLVPLENIGSGPALDVEVTITLLTEAGDISGANDAQQTVGAVAGLGVGGLVPVEVGVPALGGVPSFEARITYRDVAGKEWLTVSRYMVPRARYEDLAINPLSEGDYGLRGRLPIQPVPHRGRGRKSA